MARSRAPGRPWLDLTVPNSVSDETAFFYLATHLAQREAQPEGTEKLELMRVPFAEALRMVKEGDVTDALSVMAIQHYALWQG